MIPSEPASAKPFSAAFRVCEEDTLIAGNANAFALAVSSISAYFSGVTMGICLRSSDGRRSLLPTLVATRESSEIARSVGAWA